MFPQLLLIFVIFLSSVCDSISANTSRNSPEFISPEDVQDEDNMVVLGMILINIKQDSSISTWNMFKDKLFPMIDSLLYHSPNTNLQFIVITDQWTLEGNNIYVVEKIFNSTRFSICSFSDASKLITSAVSMFLTMNIIKNQPGTRIQRERLKLGLIKYTFVSTHCTTKVVKW